MPDNPTVLITGATDGHGRALAHRLAAEGAFLFVHGRDRRKVVDTAYEIQQAHGTKPVSVVADFTWLDSAPRIAAEVGEITDRLDVLVNNAGVGFGEPDGRTRQLSGDGYELRFAVNHLAGFLLTLELLPLLRAAAPGRVVNVASLAQHPLDFDDLMLERDYTGDRAYAQSKLAQVMAGFELADRFPASELTVNSLHPATYMPTKIVLEEVGHQVDSLADGVAATHRLATHPDLAGVTGEFYDRTRTVCADPQAYDTDARAQLWRRSIELINAVRE